MRWLIFFLFCALLIPTASADDVALTFKYGNVTITNSIAYVAVDGTRMIGFILDDGVLEMNLDRGEHRMQVILDDPSTQGNDYAGSFTIVQKDFVKSDVMLSEIGSLQGFVVDELDNMLPFADISLFCAAPPAGDMSMTENATADAFGAFFIAAAPVGSCRILANRSGKTGHADITVKKGDLADATVHLAPLKNRIDPSAIFLVMLSGIILFLVALRVINGMVFRSRNEMMRDDKGKQN